MEQKVIDALQVRDITGDASRLQGKIKKLLQNSRGRMSKYYKKWDRNLRIYRGERIRDMKDLEAIEANEPEKMVVPMSYAQTQTFVSFGFLLLTQNKNFFEMDPQRNEDYPLEEIVERGLARDLLHNQWNSKLYQHLLDLTRFSIAPIKAWWTVDTQNVDVTIPDSLVDGGVFGQVPTDPITVSQSFVKYEGNKLQCISPYHFLPDIRLPIARYREGQYVADEDQWHISNVKALEQKGLAVGTEFITRMTKDTWKSRGDCRLDLVESSLAGEGTTQGGLDFDSGDSSDDKDFMTVVTEGNIRLIPNEYKEILGTDMTSTLYTFRLCNDRLISIEKSGALHDEFNYVVGQFSSDQEAKLAEGLSDTVNALQEMITWLYNSRTTSVRRTLDSHLIVHPSYVDIASLESREPIIYLKKNAPVQDIKNVVHQLDIHDTTTGHFGDADILKQTMQFITGINDNAMGQVATGRRSATENRAANSGAAGRLKVTLACDWDQCLGPLGRMMMINQRQGMSPETFGKVFGNDPEVMALYPQFCPQDPGELIGNEDFFTFDSTLTSEKGFLAQSLQELVMAMIQNPEMAMASGFNLERATIEIQQLRGITNVTRFFDQPAQQPGVQPPVAGQQQPGGTPGGVNPVPAIPGLPAPGAGPDAGGGLGGP